MISKNIGVGIDASAPARAALGATIPQAPSASPNARRGTTLRYRPCWPSGRARTLCVPARGVGFAAAIIGMLIGGVVFASPAGATTSGYTLLNSQIIGESPTGFKVWSEPAGPHHGSIAKYSSTIASQLHTFGLPVKYAGAGNPVKTRGIITVTEGSRGCSGSTTTLANTYWYYAGVPGGGYYMYRSDIVICAARYARLSSVQRAAALRHEFGHTMGLGHTNYTYNGSVQIMNAYLHSGITTYKTGDIAGLKHLAAGTAIVRNRVNLATIDAGVLHVVIVNIEAPSYGGAQS